MKKVYLYLIAAAFLFFTEYIYGYFDVINPIYYLVLFILACEIASIFTRDERLVFKIFGGVICITILSLGSAAYGKYEPAFYLGFPAKNSLSPDEWAVNYGDYSLSIVSDHLSVTNNLTKKWRVSDVRPIGCRGENDRLVGIAYIDGALYTHQFRGDLSSCNGSFKQKLELDW